jgi:hypothetical protein
LAPCYYQPGTNATAAFHFQVLNASAETNAFYFPSGQRFDIQLIDSNDVVVANWAFGKAFPQWSRKCHARWRESAARR